MAHGACVKEFDSYPTAKGNKTKVKVFRLDKILTQLNLKCQKHFWIQIKVWIKKNLGSKNFMSKKFWVKEILGLFKSCLLTSVKIDSSNSTSLTTIYFLVLSLRFFEAANCKNVSNFCSNSIKFLACNIQSSMCLIRLRSVSVRILHREAALEMLCGNDLKVNLPCLSQ